MDNTRDKIRAALAICDELDLHPIGSYALFSARNAFNISADAHYPAALRALAEIDTRLRDGVTSCPECGYYGVRLAHDIREIIARAVGDDHDS